MSIAPVLDPSPLPASSSPTTKVPKFSRYRSVRRATSAATNDDAVVNPVGRSDDGAIGKLGDLSASLNLGLDIEEEEEEGLESVRKGEEGERKEKSDVSRSMSMARYRRPRNHGKVEGAMRKAPLQTIEQSTSAQMGTARELNAMGERSRNLDDARKTSARQQHAFTSPREQSREEENSNATSKLRRTQVAEENRRVLEKQQAIEEQRIRREEQTAQQILAEQKRKDLERLEAELEAAAPGEKASSPKERFGFLSRKFGTTKSMSSRANGTVDQGAPAIGRARTQRVVKKTIGAPQALEQVNTVEPVREQTQKVESPVKEVPKAILRGGGGIVPQLDAPVSASNAGDRSVMVRFKQSSINLPVSQGTTVLDLLRSAAEAMPHDITISHSILIESYDRLGLERRLRRYEHVRDIMNSWDNDQQNSLVIQNSDSPQRDYDLAYSHAPKAAPKDLTVYMYHSQQPGKWSKRYITLLAMGQIFVSKRLEAKVTDKDVVSICHLSDFDIYDPTSRQIRKYLKPPKKSCHAIKSQQKTNIFVNTENFVHFFSTDDEALAEKWYNTVQQWRSWYLVYRMGEGNLNRSATTASRRSSNDPLGSKQGHTSNGSIDRSAFTAGKFQERHTSPSTLPIVDDDSDEENRPRQIPFHLRHGGSMSPPLPENRRFPSNPNHRLLSDTDPSEEFASGGLLGRSYTQRRQHQQSQSQSQSQYQPQLPQQQTQRNASTPSHHPRSASPRSISRSETSGSAGQPRQKPFLDFTPSFKEAPQWDRTRLGHGVKGVQGLPLVELATGPQVLAGSHAVVGVPRETVLRRGS